MSRILEDFVKRHGHYPDSPGFKEKGGTSEEAARTTGNAGTVRAAALNILRIVGPSTADEVAAILGKSILTVRPRLTELLHLGKAEKTGIKRRNVSTKPATVWRAKP